MEQSLIDSLATQGPFAILFVWLLYWVLKQNANREERLINTLDTLSAKYDSIAKDIAEIKERITGK